MHRLTQLTDRRTNVFKSIQVILRSGISNPIESFLLDYETVKNTINDQVGWWGYMGRVIRVWASYVGRCVLREWVVGRCGFDGYRDCHWVSRSVLKDLTKDALTISAGSVFQNGTARIGDDAYNIFVGETSILPSPYCGSGAKAWPTVCLRTTGGNLDQFKLWQQTSSKVSEQTPVCPANNFISVKISLYMHRCKTFRMSVALWLSDIQTPF